MIKGKLKQLKICAYDAEDAPLISKQKKVNELVDKRLEKITDLDKKINSDDLIYRYKGNTPDLNFDEFDNAFDIIDKIRDGKINLSDVKNNQEKFKSYLEKIKKEKNQKNKKILCTILKCFTKQETKLLNFMMIILQ